ncbi:MAG: transcriptional repressor [Alphaproteobacteria bacterium]|nr:transcriptional repressor [Alphaproteobacteria bacterium]NCQ87879.1 transcriptional repressor [Alphaproteobacteria bacterium]NCT05613.1 transcriptional repressor [Alphaproteobacteria bacterium]
MTAINLEQKCIEAGLKMTEPRRAILDVLAHSEDHPSVEDVYARAKKKDPAISMATVYRTLGLLDELGLVYRHEFSDADHARYEINEEHHHHLIDLDTGKVIEFQNDEIEKMKEKIAKDLGYELIECRLELYGRKIKK